MGDDRERGLTAVDAPRLGGDGLRTLGSGRDLLGWSWMALHRGSRCPGRHLSGGVQAPLTGRRHRRLASHVQLARPARRHGGGLWRTGRRVGAPLATVAVRGSPGAAWSDDGGHPRARRSRAVRDAERGDLCQPRGPATHRRGPNRRRCAADDGDRRRRSSCSSHLKPRGRR